MWASGRGHLGVVQLLLEAEAKVNTADVLGSTSLIWAARKGHAGVVKALLSRNVNVDNAGMVSLRMF